MTSRETDAPILREVKLECARLQRRIRSCRKQAISLIDFDCERKRDVSSASTSKVLAFTMNQWDNEAMKQDDGARHPGPMRVMHVDAEFAGIIVAVGFLVMGAVGLEIGKWFVLGALVLGAVVALLLRFTRKE